MRRRGRIFRLMKAKAPPLLDKEFMEHRIAAGALVLHESKLLLVRHRKPNAYNFLVAPGGGVVGHEDLWTAAVREAKEESGFDVEPLRLGFIEELTRPGMRECKFWIWCRLIGGAPTVTHPEAIREHIVSAGFFSRIDLADETVFPPIVTEEMFWRGASANGEVRYLGVREMEFW